MNRFVKVAVIVVVGFVLCGAITAALIYYNLTKPITFQGTGVFAVDPVWNFESPDTVIASPFAGNDKVYVRTEQGVQVLEGLTGRVLFTIDVPGGALDTDRLMMYGDTLYIPALDSQLIAYQSDSADQIWRACPSGSNCGQADYYMPIETEAFSDGVLVVTRFNERMTAYDALTGKPLWEEDVPGRTSAHLAVRDDVLYVSDIDSLSEYDIHSGEQLWSEEVYYGGRVLVDGFVLYFVSGYGSETRIIEFNTSSQIPVWFVPISTQQPTVGTNLALDEQTLIVTSDSVVAIDVIKGEVLWESESLLNLQQAVIHDGKVFVRDSAGTLYAFDEATGEEIGRLPLQNRLQGIQSDRMGPAIFGDLLIVWMGSKNVVAFPLK